MPLRSNIPALAEFSFTRIEADYPRRAQEHQGEHVVVGGANYGQGSSREHAAIAPRYLGLRLVLAKSFARIHWQNLVNFGIVPLEFTDPGDYDRIEAGDVIEAPGLREALPHEHDITLRNTTRGTDIRARHRLSPRQVDILLAGGVIPYLATRS